MALTTRKRIFPSSAVNVRYWIDIIVGVLSMGVVLKNTTLVLVSASSDRIMKTKPRQQEGNHSIPLLP